MQIRFQIELPILIVEQAQIIGQIPSVKLSHRKSIAQEVKHVVRIAILDLVVFESRVLQQVHVDQSRAGEHGQWPVDASLLEPTTTARGPCRPLEEELRVLFQLLGYFGLGGQALDSVFLHLLDTLDDVAGEGFEDGQE